MISMFKKKSELTIQDEKISFYNIDGEDYISLTDMLKSKDGAFFVTDWLRNRNTLEFLGIWEQMNNPNFNYGEFATIKEKSGLNNFKISVKEWNERTNAIGLKATSGRYGGTYAHKDIAFEFGTWISPAFKLYLIKEYQRLREIESNQYNIEWNVKRMLSKANYQVHTDAIKDVLIPISTKWKKEMEYAEEADLLNLAVMGRTSKAIKQELGLTKKDAIRDYLSIIDLTLLSNAETINSMMVRDKVSKKQRFEKLKEVCDNQRLSLEKNNDIKTLDKKSLDLYIENQSKKS